MEQEALKRIDAWLQEHKEEFLEDLRDFISIPSISESQDGEYPFGKKCADSIHFFLGKAAKMGFSTENLNNIAGRATMNGQTGKQTIGIFGHGDVVPAEGEWLRDPFEMWILDGEWLVGRGVSDDKGPALGALYAMRYLKEHHIILQNNVEIYLGSAEETGMEDMRLLKKSIHFPSVSLVPDAGFPVSHGEKGILRVHAKIKTGPSNLLTLHGGQADNMVAGKAEAVVSGVDFEQAKERMQKFEFIEVQKKDGNVCFVSTGISCHSAQPEGARCAIHQLVTALSEAGFLSGSVDKALCFISQSTQDFYGESLGLSCQDESGRLTCILPLIRLEGGLLEITYNIRYPVRAKETDIRQRLEYQLNHAGFAEITFDSNPGYLREVDDVVTQLTRISNEILHVDAKPYMMSGGSYARVVPNAITYGFGNQKMNQARPFPNGQGRAHQANETISLEALFEGIKIYILALQKLDKIIERK